MKINISNAKKLTAAIEETQGRAKVRIITVDDIQQEVSFIEKRLKSLGVPKKEWRGSRFFINPHSENFPGCYRGRPEATACLVERGTKSWFVTSLYRAWCDGGVKNQIDFRNEEDFRKFYKF